MFKLTIKTGNDAFADDCRGEIARILEELANNIYRPTNQDACVVNIGEKYNYNRYKHASTGINKGIKCKIK